MNSDLRRPGCGAAKAGKVMAISARRTNAARIGVIIRRLFSWHQLVGEQLSEHFIDDTPVVGKDAIDQADPPRSRFLVEHPIAGHAQTMPARELALEGLLVAFTFGQA